MVVLGNSVQQSSFIFLTRFIDDLDVGCSVFVSPEKFQLPRLNIPSHHNGSVITLYISLHPFHTFSDSCDATVKVWPPLVSWASVEVTRWAYKTV